MVEEEANRPWDYTCDQPLFRSVLLRLIGGYVIMNIYHHAAGDGTTGMIVTRSLLDNYDILRSGGQLEASVNQPLPCIEDLTMKVKDDNDAAEEAEDRPSFCPSSSSSSSSAPPSPASGGPP